jgi:hypothetical protein
MDSSKMISNKIKFSSKKRGKENEVAATGKDVFIKAIQELEKNGEMEDALLLE